MQDNYFGISATESSLLFEYMILNLTQFNSISFVKSATRNSGAYFFDSGFSIRKAAT